MSNKEIKQIELRLGSFLKKKKTKKITENSNFMEMFIIT